MRSACRQMNGRQAMSKSVIEERKSFESGKLIPFSGFIYGFSRETRITFNVALSLSRLSILHSIVPSSNNILSPFFNCWTMPLIVQPTIFISFFRENGSYFWTGQIHINFTRQVCFLSCLPDILNHFFPNSFLVMSAVNTCHIHSGQ